ncbi:TLDc domain [Phytophthora cactorum]|nr:TLDc domain [Phytophthora cactorum]
MFSIRGLVRAIFDEQRQPTTSPRARRKLRDDNAKRRSWDVNAAETSPCEYNVSFRRKPLGVGLVPSSQLYGSWEVSSVQESESDDAPVDKMGITRGDVLIAVNFSCRTAQLPRAKLAAYYEIYGSYDSRAMSTAMYPSSVDYDLHGFSSKVVARASSMQWRRSLEHDLALNAKAAKNEKSRKLAQALVNKDIDTIHEVPPAGIAGALEIREIDTSVSGLEEKQVRPTMSELGEFDVTFNETPLHLSLAPSTRLYGSVEVYDPNTSTTVQVGDVIMAVNGYSSMSRLPSDDVIDAIAELQAPVTLRFRRPVAYRKYLATFFQTKRKELSSESIALAMFPPTPEYKRKLRTGLSPKKASTPVNKNEERVREFKAFAAKIGALDQFKLWVETIGWTQVSFLTEKHMQFLWKNLPNYLTCNQMELIYSTRVHGWSFLSFFDRLQNKGPTILVVQDEKRTSLAFVFSLSSQMNAYMWSGIDSSFMYTQRDAIFVGGGNKGIALCLQLDDRRGFTHACTTFDSPPLVDYQSFRCETVEVWASMD